MYVKLSNSIFVQKWVKIVSEDDSLHIHYSDFSDFHKYMFYMVV